MLMLNYFYILIIALLSLIDVRYALLTNHHIVSINSYKKTATIGMIYRLKSIKLATDGNNDPPSMSSISSITSTTTSSSEVSEQKDIDDSVAVTQEGMIEIGLDVTRLANQY